MSLKTVLLWGLYLRSYLLGSCLELLLWLLSITYKLNPLLHNLVLFIVFIIATERQTRSPTV